MTNASLFNFQYELLFTENHTDVSENNALHLIIQCADSSENSRILNLLKNGFDPNKPNTMGLTPMHLAVTHENYGALDHLVEFGGNINVTDPHGRTPVFYCETEKIYNKVKQFNPDLQIKDVEGYNLIQFVCKYSVNGLKFVSKMIEDGASCKNVNDDGDTCLHTFFESEIVPVIGRENILSILIKLLRFGVNINAVKKNTNTALHIAVKKNLVEMVRILLQAGANLKIVNNEGISPLDIAISSESTSLKQIIKFLVYNTHRGKTIDPEIMEKINSRPNVRQIYDMFERHIKSLNDYKVVPDYRFSYYRILNCDTKILLKMIDHPQGQNAIEFLIDEYQNDIEFREGYGREILELCREALISRQKAKAVRILENILSDRIPYLCIQRIVDFLEIHNIQNLLSFVGQSSQLLDNLSFLIYFA